VEYLALFLGCGYALIGRRDEALMQQVQRRWQAFEA